MMSKVRKRFERILNNPKDAKWDELKTIAEYFGLVCESPDRDSHWVVYHPHFEPNISVPVHNNRVKVVYVKRILQLIEMAEGEED